MLFDPCGRAAFDVLHEVAERERFVEADDKVDVISDAAGVEQRRVEVATDAAFVGEEVGQEVEGDQWFAVFGGVSDVKENVGERGGHDGW